MRPMRFSLERLVDPDLEPVSLSDMKAHLREFTGVTSADDQISALITAAREWVEGETGAALIDQTWRLTIHGIAGANFGGDTVGGHVGPGPVNYGFLEGWYVWGKYGEIMLRKRPAISIVSFKSVDSAGAETDVDAATYELREPTSKFPRLVALNGASWGTWLTGDLRITFRAGFVDESTSPSTGTVPERFKLAMKLYAEANYDRDPATMALLLDTAKRLILPERSDLQIA